MTIPKEQKSTGTLVALLLVVLRPALCVVWLMNVAMRDVRLAVQQTLTDAYHNHLLSPATPARHGMERQANRVQIDYERRALGNVCRGRSFAPGGCGGSALGEAATKPS
jgi:hypothetical protein